MRKAAVYLRGEYAGELTEFSRNEYIFKYDNDYFENMNKPAISLTLPKSQKEFRLEYLFPFFSICCRREAIGLFNPECWV